MGWHSTSISRSPSSCAIARCASAPSFWCSFAFRLMWLGLVSCHRWGISSIGSQGSSWRLASNEVSPGRCRLGLRPLGSPLGFGWALRRRMHRWHCSIEHHGRMGESVIASACSSGLPWSPCLSSLRCWMPRKTALCWCFPLPLSSPQY